MTWGPVAPRVSRPLRTAGARRKRASRSEGIRAATSSSGEVTNSIGLLGEDLH
jgi:hypothetical protein